MPTDRPLRNLTRDDLLGVYTELQSEPASKKYNLRKELQTDKREATVHTNRWLTRDQYLEMARQEMAARGLEIPGEAATAATVATNTAEAPADSAAPVDPEAGSAPPATEAPLAGVTSGALTEGIVGEPRPDA